MIVEIEFAAPISAADLGSILGHPLEAPIELAEAAGAVVRAKARGLHDLDELAMQLRTGAVAAVLVKNVHDCSNIVGPTPVSMIPDPTDGRCHPNAITMFGLMHAFGMKPVSFSCENRGAAYVNLVPAEYGEGRLIVDSRDEMGGHTDLLSFPYAHEFGPNSFAPSGPDSVMLAGLRNRNRILTYVSPLSALIEGLSSKTIDQLFQSKFVFDRQGSIDISFGYIAYDRPVLAVDPYRGPMIRFSGTKVWADEKDHEAEKALEELRKLVPRVRTSVVVGAGDVLLLNNRAALHGRGRAEHDPTGESRWLLRSYGHYGDTEGRPDATRRFVMQCAPD